MGGCWQELSRVTIRPSTRHRTKSNYREKSGRISQRNQLGKLWQTWHPLPSSQIGSSNMLTEYNSQKIVQTKQSEVGQIPHMKMLPRVATDLVSSNGRCENRSYNFFPAQFRHWGRKLGVHRVLFYFISIFFFHISCISHCAVENLTYRRKHVKIYVIIL